MADDVTLAELERRVIKLEVQQSQYVQKDMHETQFAWLKGELDMFDGRLKKIGDRLGWLLGAVIVAALALVANVAAIMVTA